MKTNLLTIAFVLAIVFAAACKKEDKTIEKEPVKINLTAKSAEVIGASNQFGIKLFSEVAKEEDGNMMLSPLSASAALTMLLNGTATDTYDQIRDMLGYDAGMTIDEINEAYKSIVSQLLVADNEVSLALANAVFYKSGFQVKPPFLAAMNEAFDAHIEGLDFTLPSSVDRINKWAADNTNNKIDKVLDEINPIHVMFLMNALYFKGDWTTQFDKNDTEKRPFTLKDGSQLMIDAMYHEKMAAITHYGQDYHAIEMPFGRKNFSMMVVVPNGNFDAFLNELSPEVWDGIAVHFNALDNWAEVPLQMPKFRFAYEKELNDYLEALGMLDAFYEHLADLSGISNAELFVDFVKQNTFIEVNEEGAEAAAVTTIGIAITSAPQVFMVDKPFIFAIRERTTNTLLFIGSVVNPAE